jgi:predicted transcriptional regulator
MKMKQELVQDWMTKNVITIAPDATLPEAHRLMADNQIRRLPVVRGNNTLVGIITRGDVREAEPSDASSLSIWEMNYLLSKLKIDKIMTSDPITIHAEETIGDAASRMLSHKISGLPVVDGSGKLIGVITESDIFRLVVKNWGIAATEDG